MNGLLVLFAGVGDLRVRYLKQVFYFSGCREWRSLAGVGLHYFDRGENIDGRILMLGEDFLRSYHIIKSHFWNSVYLLILVLPVNIG